MKKKITIVIDTENQQEILDFWSGVFKIKKEQKDTAEVMSVKLGNYIELKERYEKYAKALRGQVSISLTGELRVDSLGESWWQHIGGFYANNKDFFQATKVYDNLVDLESLEGKTILKS